MASKSSRAMKWLLLPVGVKSKYPSAVAEVLTILSCTPVMWSLAIVRLASSNSW
ncbi:hypothetical protein [Rubritalea tangerina]|uniref:hypothetical protein n=1 Tax=Rubritalea tangerina TaxID=430798 RepID=UPI0036181001